VTSDVEFAELVAMLPSRNIDRLAAAIGHCLRDVVRVFVRSETAFGADGAFDARDEFRFNSGQTMFSFDEVVQTIGVWASQLSVALMSEADRELLTGDPDCRVMRLSESGDALVHLLGLPCEDVRIWTYEDGDDSDRACESAISYCLHGGAEIFYCTWLHGDMDSDYLLPGHLVWRDRARSCWSVARRAALPWTEYAHG